MAVYQVGKRGNRYTFLVFTLRKTHVFPLSDLKVPGSSPFPKHTCTFPSAWPDVFCMEARVEPLGMEDVQGLGRVGGFRGSLYSVYHAPQPRGGCVGGRRTILHSHAFFGIWN